MPIPPKPDTEFDALVEGLVAEFLLARTMVEESTRVGLD